MMLSRRLAGSLALLLLIATQATYAQEPTHDVRVSFGAGYERSVIDNRIMFSTWLSACECVDPKGVEAAFSGSALFTAAFYRVRPSIDLGFRMELSQLSVRFEESLQEGTRLSDMFPLEATSPEEPPTQTDMRVRYAVAMHLLRFDLMARGGFLLRGLEAESGLTVGYRSFTAFDVSFIAPSNTRFLNPGGLPTDRNGKELIINQGSWPGPNDMTLGAVAGLSYTFPVGNGFSATPGIVLRKEFVFPEMGGGAWPSIYLRAGVSLGYTFAGAPFDEAYAAPPERSIDGYSPPPLTFIQSPSLHEHTR